VPGCCRASQDGSQVIGADQLDLQNDVPWGRLGRAATIRSTRPPASERAYSAAHVLATEQAIEREVERGVENLDAARVTSEVAAGAMSRQNPVLGSPLTPGRQAAVMGIATPGRGVELVEGWPDRARPRSWPLSGTPLNREGSWSSARRPPVRRPGRSVGGWAYGVGDSGLRSYFGWHTSPRA
jgi:hypothetical protein